MTFWEGKFDWRMQVFSTKPFSFLETVGDENMQGTFKNCAKSEEAEK